ncbi:hypothetical protein IWX47DRAFT_861582 [Phyllosticta citricarpa]
MASYAALRCIWLMVSSCQLLLLLLLLCSTCSARSLARSRRGREGRSTGGNEDDEDEETGAGAGYIDRARWKRKLTE